MPRRFRRLPSSGISYIAAMLTIIFAPRCANAVYGKPCRGAPSLCARHVRARRPYRSVRGSLKRPNWAVSANQAIAATASA